MNISKDATLDIKKIQTIPFKEDQYFKTAYPKKQIVLHHSAGWDDARGMFHWWSSNKERVATFCGVVDDGTIVQGFNSRYWAWHINVGSRFNKLPVNLEKYQNPMYRESLERGSIGIEICNWGGLRLVDGKFLSWANKEVPANKVIDYGKEFRGYQYYERYTDKEMETVYVLVKYLAEKYEIPVAYTRDIWNIHEPALRGDPGIYTHVSYRTDKSDCHPQPELAQVLKALS